MRLRGALVVVSVLAVALTSCKSVDQRYKDADPLACGDPSCPTYDEPKAVGPGGTVTLDAGDLFFDNVVAAAAEGDVEFTMANVGIGLHNVTIDGVNGGEPIAEAPGGETATGVGNLAAGEYVFYCAIPGHRSAGMEGTLEVVTAAEASAQPTSEPTSEPTGEATAEPTEEPTPTDEPTEGQASPQNATPVPSESSTG